MSPGTNNTPPRWVRKFLGFFLDPRILEASLGDLEEKYQRNLKNGATPWKASLFYAMEGVGFVRLASRLTSPSAQTAINMFNHTLMFFLRLMRKDKSYYLVSTLGLALSLSSFLFIAMFINDELSYDQFHENKKQVYRLTTHLKLSDVEYNLATSQFPAAEAIRTELPEVEKTVRVYPQTRTFEYETKKIDEHIILVDPDFLDVFSFPLLYGEINTALAEPASIVLSQSAAKKIFDVVNPVGRSLMMDGQALTVTGIMQDVPVQSHLQFGAIMPLSFQLNAWKKETGIEGRENKWFWIGAYTYVKLKDNANAGETREKLSIVINKYFPDRYKQNGRFGLQPLTDIHLRSDLSEDISQAGSMLYVRLFSIVAILIMIVSAINLINLSWFKLSGRVREVGIRKFLGQHSASVIAQLSMESILVGMIGFLITIGLCVLLLPEFNLLVEKNLVMWSGPNLSILGFTFLMILVICVGAVIRPSLHFAGQSSLYLLLQKYSTPGVARMRNMLVGMQVCFSFVLLVFSLTITSQIDFFKNKDLGFEKKNVVVVPLNEDIYKHAEAFRNELKKSKNVVDVAGGAAPGKEFNGWRFVPEGGSYEKPFLFPFAWCDFNYISTLRIKLLAGHDFDPAAPSDSLWSFIINKRAALELGFADDPLNKTMEVFAPGTTEIMARGRVIGVIDDYHYGSLHKAVKPVVLTSTNSFGNFLVRIADGSDKDAIADMTLTWKNFSSKPFGYELLSDRLDKLYTNEAKLSNIMLFFTFIALFLTCYGMFAMSSLLFVSKLKEVSIRKVFGAGHLSIIRQFYSRYAVFNLAAIGVGIPIAVYVGNLWLETFQYRITLDINFFLAAGGFIMIAGLLSVSYNLVRITWSNPIRFLRRE